MKFLYWMPFVFGLALGQFDIGSGSGSGSSMGTTVKVLSIHADVPVYPEGIAYDRINDRLYLSSIADSQIFALDPLDSTELTTFSMKGEDQRICLGIEYDHERDQLWCALSTFDPTVVPPAKNGALASFSFHDCNASMAIVEHLNEFPVNNNVSRGANDVSLSRDGTAYVSDWIAGAVYKFAPFIDSDVQLLSDSPLLAPIQLSGANGIVVTEKYVITAALDRGVLVRIDRYTGIAIDIELDASYNGDGLLLLPSGHLVIVTGNAVVLVEEVAGSNWTKAKTMEVVDIEVMDGAFLTTAALGEEDDIIYVTSVRFFDIFGPDAPGLNTDPSLVYKIEFDL